MAKVDLKSIVKMSDGLADSKSKLFDEEIKKTDDGIVIGNTIEVDIDLLHESEFNIYPLIDIEELAGSIEQFGLLSELMVKANGDGTYTIVAGHRRYNAIKHLIANGNEENRKVRIFVISDKEDELTTRIKLHESNLQVRPLLKMSEEERLAIIEDYMEIITKARKFGLTINGKELKGKTREIIAKEFNISTGKAQELMAKVNSNGKEKVVKTKTYKDMDKLLRKTINNILDLKDIIQEDMSKEKRQQLDALVKQIQEIL